MEGSSSSKKSIVPDSVMESVKISLTHLEQVGAEWPQLLALCSDPQVMGGRATSLLLLSKLTTTLFTVRLRGCGVYDDDHRVNTELERLKLYQEKLHRFIELSKDLRQSMREISKGGEGGKMKYLERNAQKKRKYQSPNRPSVHSAAKEFLEKAARELLGDGNAGLKGPLRPELLDQDNLNVE